MKDHTERVGFILHGKYTSQFFRGFERSFLSKLFVQHLLTYKTDVRFYTHLRIYYQSRRKLFTAK